MPGEEIRIPLEPRRPLGRPHGRRRDARAPQQAEHGGDAPPGVPVFDNTETHWWDGSQLYGSTPGARPGCARARAAA